MRRTLAILCAWLSATAALAADDVSTPVAAAQTAANASAVTKPAGERAKKSEAKAAAKPDAGDKALSGMSILGNQEAPKALVIVPWKSSQLGDAQGISRQLDDGRQPVDKDVFMRELSYYEIRTGSK
jgi:hypothetical protein